MFLAILVIIGLFLGANRPVFAQIPIYYQLIQAYHPDSLYTPPPAPVPQISPSVLGTAASPEPQLSSTSTDQVITIAVLGDSMIDTLGKGIPQLETALRQYFPNRKFRIINYGVGSSNIEYALFRLSNDYDYLGEKHLSLLSQNPDIVVVESFAYNNFGNTQTGFDRQWLALGAITTTIRQKLPLAKIVLAATVAPNSITFCNGCPDLHFTAMDKVERSSTIKLYLQNLINFATSQNFPLADSYHPSLFANEGFKDFINTTDFIHPSAFGGQFFCDTLAKTIYDYKLIN